MSRLLVTDLDGTFAGDDAAMHGLWAELDEQGITLAFATGRHLPAVQSLYRESRTDRRAAACICMVGTEIWIWSGRDYELDQEWARRISVDWDRDSVERALDAVTGATLQPVEWQSPLKASYFLDGEEETGQSVEAALRDAGLRAKVVWSNDLYLDVLPAASGKGEAAAYLAEMLDVDPSGVVTAGDSGNDLDMMRPELGFRSVVVGNAVDELASFHAPGVYHAAAGWAAGVREGLVHHGWLPR